MTRAVTVPPAVRLAFLEALKQESRQAAGLPDPLPIGRVLNVWDRASDCADQLSVLVLENEDGYFLDYYTVGNDGETSWHGRVFQDGTGKPLENIEAQLGRPSIDDPVKKAAYEAWLTEHNTRVRQILKAKGFT